WWNRLRSSCRAGPRGRRPIRTSEARSEDFEQPGGAHAAADAPRDDDGLRVAPLAVHQDVAGQAGAGHAERVADRDRAAVDVVDVGIDAEGVAAVEALAREGLVELPQVDVVDLQALALEQPGNREDGADAHLVRLAAGDRPALERAHGLQAATLGLPGLHDHHGGRAVRELAGVAGGDELVGALDRLQLGQAFEGGVRTVALVAVDDDIDDRLGAGGLVDLLHLRLDRDDLVLELAGFLRGGHELLAAQRVLVLVFAADVV